MLKEKEFEMVWGKYSLTDAKLVAVIPFGYQPQEEVVLAIREGFSWASYYMKTETAAGIIIWVVEE